MWMLGKIDMQGGSVLDVGSMDINGTYKPLFNENWDYKGLDVAPGKNVDIVGEPYKYPLADNSFDLVISGQCLEHVEDTHAWTDEVIRVAKGLIIIVVPCMWDMHMDSVHYPGSTDCWRVYPDGLRYLFVKRGKTQEIFISHYQPEKFGFGETYGIFRKV